MPIYEFKCPIHGRFEILSTSGISEYYCPHCQAICRKVISAPAKAHIVHNERLPLGNKSRGKLIMPEETGGLGILVPSFGALEKEEVEYVAQGALEKERERIAKKGKLPSRTRSKIQVALSEAYRTRPGQRAKIIREVIANSGDKLTVS